MLYQVIDVDGRILAELHNRLAAYEYADNCGSDVRIIVKGEE